MAAIEAMQAGNFDTALEQFIGVIQSDRYYDDDGARKACVALFTLLGNEHPAVKKYRRRFDMALY
jgi:putative thioredoxin